MAPVSSQQALEQSAPTTFLHPKTVPLTLIRLLEMGGFATDFTNIVRNKTFAVHRSVIDQVLPDNNLDGMACGNDELVLDVTTEVAEDFIRHSYALQIPCLRRVAGLKPTVGQCLRVLHLSREAAVNYFDYLTSDCNNWLREAVQSSADDPELLVAIGENLPYSSIMMDEMTGVYEDLLEKLAASMQTILTGRKDLLQGIVKYEELHCGMLGLLAARSETLQGVQKAKNDEVLAREH